MKPSQRGILADAALAAGATVLLLFSTDTARGGTGALVGGIALVVAGIVLLWGVPRPTLRTRMLSSIGGLFIGYGLAIAGLGPGAWLSLGSGTFLLAALWIRLGR